MEKSKQLLIKASFFLKYTTFFTSFPSAWSSHHCLSSHILKTLKKRIAEVKNCHCSSSCHAFESGREENWGSDGGVLEASGV